MDENPQLERRDEARFALKAPALVRQPRGRPWSAKLLDVSTQGCRLMLPEPWPAETPFWLTIAHLPPRFSHVVWSQERFAGVRFAVPIEAADFQALIDTYGALTERDTAELKRLSQRCAELARDARDVTGHLASLASACGVEASAFDAALHAERLAATEARTRQLLERLSTRRG